MCHTSSRDELLLPNNTGYAIFSVEWSLERWRLIWFTYFTYLFVVFGSQQPSVKPAPFKYIVCVWRSHVKNTNMPMNVGVKFKSCRNLIRYSKYSLNLNSSVLRKAAFVTKKASTWECFSVTSDSAVGCSSFPSPLVSSVAWLHTSLVIHDENVPKTDPELKQKQKPKVSLPEGPSLKDFILNSFETTDNASAHQHEDESVPYLHKTDYSGNNRRGMHNN